MTTPQSDKRNRKRLNEHISKIKFHIQREGGRGQVYILTGPCYGYMHHVKNSTYVTPSFRQLMKDQITCYQVCKWEPSLSFSLKNINRESRGGKGTKKKENINFYRWGKNFISPIFKTLPLMMCARP